MSACAVHWLRHVVCRLYKLVSKRGQGKKGETLTAERPAKLRQTSKEHKQGEKYSWAAALVPRSHSRWEQIQPGLSYSDKA